MEEAIAWLFIIAAILVLLAFYLKYVLIGLYWFFAVASYLFFGVLDSLFSASLMPGAPWVMWLCWGAVLGAALAFWTLAPIYGLRKQRPWILAAPFMLMVLTALTRMVVTSV